MIDWVEVGFKILFVCFALFVADLVFGENKITLGEWSVKKKGGLRGTRLHKPVKIYYLKDHKGQPFYAGRTNRALAQRHDEHCKDAKEWGTPKQRYIWLMQQMNQRPTIHLITTVTTTEEDAQRAERQAISQFGVTNVTIP